MAIIAAVTICVVSGLAFIVSVLGTVVILETILNVCGASLGGEA